MLDKHKHDPERLNARLEKSSVVLTKRASQMCSLESAGPHQVQMLAKLEPSHRSLLLRSHV